MEDGETLDHKGQAGQTGHTLGDDGGQSGPGHAGMAVQDQEQVQGDVQHRGDGKEIHGCFAVPQGPDHRSQQIIEEGGGDAQEDDEDIPVGPIKDVLRGPHHGEDGAAEQAGEHCQHHGEQGGQPPGVGHTAAHLAVISGSHALGHRNGEAVAHPHAEADDKEVDGAGGADRGQGGGAQQLPHDHGVHHVIKLLEQHSEQGGQGETPNEPHRAACGEISGHGSFLLGGVKRKCSGCAAKRMEQVIIIIQKWWG